MTDAQTSQTTTEQGRSQSNITWKPGHKATFQAALDSWTQTAPKGAGAGDFIISLLARQTKGETAEATASRLASLGIEALVDMHRRRMEADDRMLEQIADLIEDSQAKAREEAATELKALQKTAALATQTAEREHQDREAAERLREELETSLDAATGELDSAKRQIDSLATDLKAAQETQGREAQATRAALDHAAELESDLAQTRTALAESQQATLEARTERDRTALELDAARHKIEAITTELASVKKNLDTSQAKQTQTEADLTQAKTALAEAQANLETERRTTAALEAKAQAQGETISALREAIAAFKRPWDEPQPTTQKPKRNQQS